MTTKTAKSATKNTRPPARADTTAQSVTTPDAAAAPTAPAVVAPEAHGPTAPERTAPATPVSALREAPTLAPQTADRAEAAVQAVSGTYQTNRYVDALWSIDETRNAWALIRGLGWRKLHHGNDGAFTGLVYLAGQARQTGRPITFREEADGMIYEIYLW